MYKLPLGLLLAGTVSVAAAGDLGTSDAARYADSNDYSARVVYTLDFGGAQGQANAHSMGLRFDNERLAAYGAPALFHARFDGQGNLDALKLNGVELRGQALAAGQSDDGFAAYTTTQWIALAVTGALFIAVAADVSDDEDDSVPGTGGN